jgi:hypothetical protein
VAAADALKELASGINLSFYIGGQTDLQVNLNLKAQDIYFFYLIQYFKKTIFTFVIFSFLNFSVFTGFQRFQSLKEATRGEDTLHLPTNWDNVEKTLTRRCCGKKDEDNAGACCLKQVDEKGLMAIRLQLYRNASGGMRNLAEVLNCDCDCQKNIEFLCCGQNLSHRYLTRPTVCLVYVQSRGHYYYCNNYIKKVLTIMILCTYRSGRSSSRI